MSQSFSFTHDGSPIKFTYTNHRGETSERTVRLVALRWGITEWHPEPQWFLRAWDDDREDFRDFALSGVKGSE